MNHTVLSRNTVENESLKENGTFSKWFSEYVKKYRSLNGFVDFQALTGNNVLSQLDKCFSLLLVNKMYPDNMIT